MHVPCLCIVFLVIWIDSNMWSALVPAGLAFVGGLLANRSRESTQNSTNAFNAEQYSTRYQTQVKDMEAAGLNPAMAHYQGPGSPSVASAPQVDNVLAPAVEQYRQSQLSNAQVANINADTDNKKAQAELIAAQAAHYTASAGQSLANTDRIKSETDKIAEQIVNIREDTLRLRFLQQQLAESAALMAQQGQSEVVRRHHLQAMIANLRRDGVVKDADILAIEKTGGIGRLARELKPASDIVHDWVPRLFKNRGKK